MSDAVVFDAEPILAYLNDEPGSVAVEEWFDRVASGEIDVNDASIERFGDEPA
ncbi:hypothetical protein ACFQDG_07260 [Natronoarchaeum mannanilyticum]|uniref:Type II toxin-antitoxin system VapC family toxin n=1 Tax=Natronoarchaeum mannanilyticum TaxID=926360 RepID=A0AAV3TC21_9EURY